jgi:hypothetical protein
MSTIWSRDQAGPLTSIQAARRNATSKAETQMRKSTLRLSCLRHEWLLGSTLKRYVIEVNGISPDDTFVTSQTVRRLIHRRFYESTVYY